MSESGTIIFVSIISVGVLVAILLILSVILRRNRVGENLRIILNSPIVILPAITLIILFATILIWIEFDELTLMAWSIVLGSLVAMIATLSDFIQSKKSDELQKNIARLEYMPCLYLSQVKNKDFKLFSLFKNKKHNSKQNFELECVSEHPAFGIKWFVWYSPKEVSENRYEKSDYDKSKIELKTPIYTAVKGKRYVLDVKLNFVYSTAILSAEYEDIAGNRYTQLFNLELDSEAIIFKVLKIGQPH